MSVCSRPNVDDGGHLITIIRFSGEIADDEEGAGMGLSSARSIDYNSYRRVIEEAFGVPGLLAVILIINSPGGSPVQGNLIANFIRECSVRSKTPVYAVVEDMAASAGYDLACAADEIYIDENSAVGSIGVIFMSVGVSSLLEKIGVEPRILTAGDHKAGLHPFLKEDKEEIETIKGQVHRIHTNFEGWVKSRRPKLADDKDIFSGRVYYGKEAVKVGLADGIKSLSELVKSKFGTRDDLRLVEVKRKIPPPSLAEIAKSMVSPF